jgi:hypothetical protein
MCDKNTSVRSPHKIQSSGEQLGPLAEKSALGGHASTCRQNFLTVVGTSMIPGKQRDVEQLFLGNVADRASQADEKAHKMVENCVKDCIHLVHGQCLDRALLILAVEVASPFAVDRVGCRHAQVELQDGATSWD